MIGDAGRASGLAWVGASAAALSLTVGLIAGSPAAVHAAVALLGVIFLLRQETRLLLAAPYGASLLLMEDFAIQTVELRGVSQTARGVIGGRTATTLSLATAGGCASAGAALAVTAAPGRSVAVTALGAVAAVAAFAAIVRPARRRYGKATAGEPRAPLR